jgi:hypothetical protein
MFPSAAPMQPRLCHCGLPGWWPRVIGHQVVLLCSAHVPPDVRFRQQMCFHALLRGAAAREVKRLAQPRAASA